MVASVLGSVMDYRGIDLSRFVDVCFPTAIEGLSAHHLPSDLSEPTTDGRSVFGLVYDGVLRSPVCFELGASEPRWRTQDIDVESNALVWDGSLWVGTRSDGEFAELVELSAQTGGRLGSVRLALDSRSPFVLHFAKDALWARAGDDVWRVRRGNATAGLVASQIARVSWVGCLGVLDDVLGVEATEGSLRARDLSSGETRWSTEVSLRGMSLTLDPFRKAVLYGRYDYRGGIHVVALDASSGEERWHKALEVNRTDLLGAFSLAAHPERILVRDGSNTVLGLSPDTGEEQWRATLPQLEGEILATQNLLLVTGGVGFGLDVQTGNTLFELPSSRLPADIELLGTSLPLPGAHGL